MSDSDGYELSDGATNQDANVHLETPAAPAPQERPAEQSYDDAPQSWKRDIADRHWRALPEDLRGYLHNRETESHGKISELGTTLAQMRETTKRYEPIEGAFARYQQYIPEGLPRERAIEALLEVNRLLEDEQTRPHAIGQMLQMYGVDR